MKLYYVPATRATRARWMLEELEVPYELARLDVTAPARQNRTPEYLALNPGGHVPTLVDDDGQAIYESLAICLWLADRYPEKGLAPAPTDPERGRYLQWAVYSMTTLERSVDTVNRHRNRLPEAERVPAVAAAAEKAFHEDCRAVEEALKDKEFLVAGRFTAADLMMAAVLGWGKLLGMLKDNPELEAYVRRCVSRPAAKRSRQD